MLALGFLLAGSQTALAICNPHRSGGYFGSRFSGGYNYSRGGAVTDTEATVTDYTPYVDFGNSGSVSTWTMLAKTSCSYGFAQAGMLELWHPYSEVFTEVSQCNTVMGPHEVGGRGVQHFKVQFGYCCVVAAIEGTTPILGNTTVDWVPDQVQTFSETHANDDQNEGGTQNQQLVSQMVQCDGTGCYTNAIYCLLAGNQSGCPGSTAYWMDLTNLGTSSPVWATYDTYCAT
jgi:hypothetical protein